MFKKILVPLDGSSLSEQVIPLATELLDGGAEEATLFTVGQPPKATRLRRKGLRRPFPLAALGGTLSGDVVPAIPDVSAETRDQAIEREEHKLLMYLDRAGRPLVTTGRPVHGAVRIGDPARELIDFAREGGFDLVVMATHGRSGLRQTLQGSVTAEVIRSGVAPVLVVRPKQQAPVNGAAAPVRVLLIDDQTDVHSALAQRLRRDHRLEVVGTASSVVEAADLLADARPDIVLLDIHGRRQHGVDACKALGQLTDAQVIVFAAYMTPELWAAVHEAGAADYLLKHVDTDQLSRQIVRLVRRHEPALIDQT